MKKSSCIKMYDSKGKQSGLMMEGSAAYMESMANYGSPYKMEGPGDPDKKKKEELTKAQKLTMAGAALGEDVSFEVKTIDDPRSSRSVIDIKNRLKKEKPEQYKKIYGK
ncbi:MAG: hypothetical protein HKN86_03130 [Acidimicrobiia bacterium]|nr:hypothetical protein [Acidimicrobiia bacterium]